MGDLQHAFRGRYRGTLFVGDLQHEVSERRKGKTFVEHWVDFCAKLTIFKFQRKVER